jgi:hypothetical protein
LATACAEGEAESATVSSDEMTPTTLCVADYGLLSGLDETELNFSWYKDGQLDAAQCGWGKTTYQLVASRSTGATHAVKLVVTTGTALKTAASGGMTLKVVGPTVVITEPAERMEQSDAVAGEASRFMRVTPGETITLTAATQNFGPDTEYEWFWQVGNATAQAAGTAAENGFSYFVPGDVPMGSSIAASVQVRAKDAQQQVTDVTDSLQLVVGETAAQTGMGRSVNGTLAALFSVIPPAWRQSVQIVLVLFAFGGLLLGGAYFYQRVFGR